MAELEEEEWLAPVGLGVEIDVTETHPDWVSRIGLMGVDQQEVFRCIRTPNAGLSDRPDPEPPKIRRWIRLNGKLVRVLLIVIRPAVLHVRPGKVQLVTLFHRKNEANP